MPISYDFYENPKSNSEEETSYHLRAISMGTVSTRDIAKRIQNETSLTRSDVMACLAALSHCMTSSFAEGHRVHLEGIGYFQIALQAPEGWDSTQRKVRGVRVKGVRFRADSLLNDQVQGLSVVRCSEHHSSHSSKRTSADRERLLRSYFSEHDYITSREFAALCGLVTSTARRCLACLCQENKIRNIGTRNMRIYIALPALMAEESES